MVSIANRHGYTVFPSFVLKVCAFGFRCLISPHFHALVRLRCSLQAFSDILLACSCLTLVSFPISFACFASRSLHEFSGLFRLDRSVLFRSENGVLSVLAKQIYCGDTLALPPTSYRATDGAGTPIATALVESFIDVFNTDHYCKCFLSGFVRILVSSILSCIFEVVSCISFACFDQQMETPFSRGLKKIQMQHCNEFSSAKV